MVFFSSIVLVIFSLYSPFLLDLLPNRQEESFVALALLGEEGVIADYFPDDAPIVFRNSSIKWHINVLNRMGGVQHVIIRVRFADSKHPLPNSSACVSSPAPVIFEFQRVLSDNETLIIPFEWSLVDIDEVGDTYNITKIKINDHMIPIDYEVVNDEVFKMIFEIWVFEESMHEFNFEWFNMGETRCAWNHIQFKISI